MSTKTALQKAINICGMSHLAKEIGVPYQSIRGWMNRNQMPYKEYACKTNYALGIEKATEGVVTVTDLLGHIPTCQVIAAGTRAVRKKRIRK